MVGMNNTTDNINYNACSMLCINSRFNISLTIILKTERR